MLGLKFPCRNGVLKADLPDLPAVGERSTMRQLVMNLVINA
jgi:hypothetical protein